MFTKILIWCGILSSLLYIAMNIFIPLQFEGYSYASHTVSELSAIDAPTRHTWVPLGMVYILLFAAFGWGIWKSAKSNRHMRILAGLVFAYCMVNFYWPPMHLRGNTPTLTDTLHIVWAMIAVIFMMLMMGFGAAALGKRFKWYTITSMALLVGFGILTALEGPKIPANLPTPWLGVWERIMIFIFLLWVIVLAGYLLKNRILANQSVVIN